MDSLGSSDPGCLLKAKLVGLGSGGSFRHSPPRMSGSETSSVSPITTPAPHSLLASESAAGAVGESLGAQSPAARAQDKFNSNRSIGAGGILVPGPRKSLGQDLAPSSDSFADAAEAVLALSTLWDAG